MKKQSNNYVVIMAGGIGSRFWPQSRVDKPKQFLDVLNTGKTLIQSTFDRYKTIVPSENIYVVTTTEYYGLVLEQLDFLNPENLILEPERKNTAPCIGYACYKISGDDIDFICLFHQTIVNRYIAKLTIDIIHGNGFFDCIEVFPYTLYELTHLR